MPEPIETLVLRPNEPRTVAAGFAEFCERLVPKYTESAESVAMLQTIERCLRSCFDLKYLAPYGSRGHGTNVQGFSAVDGFAVIPNAELFEASGASLEQVRECLSRQLSDVFITEGRPVVAVPFGTRRSEKHHIVPAFVHGAKGEHDVYHVPAPRNRWIGICPAAHSIWINQLDDTLNNNLKAFIRAVKAWSYYNDDVVWPYYLELCAADYLKDDCGVTYSQDLCNFLDYLADRNLAPFEDTAGCAEPVYGTSIADREKAMTVIRHSLKLAKRAVACENRGDVHDAFYWWRKIFDWRFATY